MRMPTMVKLFLPIGLRLLGNARSQPARNLASSWGSMISAASSDVMSG
jgi:hypothetical protein